MKNQYIIIFTLFLALCLYSHNAQARQEPLAGPLTGEVINVLDGDTVTVRVQIWLGQSIETRIRINGIDTPEIRGKCSHEREMAQTAKQELIHLLHDKKIHLTNIKNGKYAGRVIADAVSTDGIDIKHYMIEKGLARPYTGKKRKTWCA